MLAGISRQRRKDRAWSGMPSSVVPAEREARGPEPMNTGRYVITPTVFIGSGFAPSARPGMTSQERAARVLRAVAADDGDRADVLVGKAAEIVHQPARNFLFALTRPGAAEELQIDLVDHPQARGADR